uniref:Zgc:162331 n=1 Tax=Myripristis murdjan TaxID=586833 RepID=A0A668AJJ9_9TELE
KGIEKERRKREGERREKGNTGTGVSVGSVLAFWCREGYQLVGSDKIYCNVRNGKPQWSNYLPVCEAIPRPEDRGLRVAVLASVVSGIVILAMSLSFLICCLQERSSRNRDRAKRDGLSDLLNAVLDEQAKIPTDTPTSGRKLPRRVEAVLLQRDQPLINASGFRMGGQRSPWRWTSTFVHTV